MISIFQRELRSYFNSMIGYVYIAAVLFFIGVYFMAYNLQGGYPKFSYALLSLTSIFMFVIPILTMKSMAEERRAKTDQLLLTAPVTLTGIVLGKYLAMVAVMAIPVALSGICPLIIAANGTAYLKSDYASIAAFLLLGCVYVAVGMFISSLTESQIIAAIGTFAVLLVLNLWNGFMSFLPVIVSDVLSKFAFSNVFANFAQYDMFDMGGLVLYLSLAFLFVFLTVQTLQKRRWN